MLINPTVALSGKRWLRRVSPASSHEAATAGTAARASARGQLESGLSGWLPAVCLHAWVGEWVVLRGSGEGLNAAVRPIGCLGTYY